ncbi:hypothetical protein [Prochlorococcus sp. MIT 0916]|uniref:hypothetical protein n=1 Tax=Prochlorococcus sp. MIT 0916 TaxID=3082521 RepID=UPI0039B56039
MKIITSTQIESAARRWKKYGWYDYEMNRAKKGTKILKWAPKAAIFTLAAFGIPIGE